MATVPYLVNNPGKSIGFMKMFTRMGAYPLDATSVFNSKAEVEAYINEPGSYAYPGQMIAVSNGDVSDSSSKVDYTVYVIRSDKTLQEVGKNLVFDSVEAAEAHVTLNTDAVKTGELVVIADVNAGYQLYVVKADRTIEPIIAKTTSLSWNNITDKPTTLEGYGITDAVKSSDVVEIAEANKILKLNSNAKLPSNILEGIIPIENIPHAALERCVVVTDDEARFALTSETVQLGDTVKVESSGVMYFVKDVENLNSEAGYEVYKAGTAASVDWSGIQNGPTSIVTDIDDAVTKKHNHDNAAVLDKITEDDDSRLKHGENTVAYTSDIKQTITLSSTEPEGLPVGGLWFEEISSTESEDPAEG